MTRPLAESYPLLHRLFAGYANQDFDAHGADPLDAVRAFARDATPPERAAALEELRRLRAARTTERALSSALARLRSGVDPAAYGGTGPFLDAVAKVLAASAAR